MLYYHYLNKCKEEQLRGAIDVISWIDCICQLLLNNTEKLNGYYLFVRCNEVDDNLNSIPNEVSFYICRFNSKQYLVVTYFEKVKCNQPLPTGIRDTKFKSAFLFGESPNIAICRQMLEKTCHIKDCQTLSLENLTHNTLKPTKKTLLQKQSSLIPFSRIKLFFILITIAFLLSFAVLINKLSQQEVNTQQKSFPEIEGVYFIEGVDKEGFAAEIIRNPKDQYLFYLYILSEYSTPQYDIFYDQEKGIIKSNELGEGKVLVNEKEKTILIKFKEWTLSK